MLAYLKSGLFHFRTHPFLNFHFTHIHRFSVEIFHKSDIIYKTFTIVPLCQRIQGYVSSNCTKSQSSTNHSIAHFAISVNTLCFFDNVAKSTRDLIAGAYIGSLPEGGLSQNLNTHGTTTVLFIKSYTVLQTKRHISRLHKTDLS